MKPMGKLQDTTLLTVNELMNEDHQWNVSLVRELFFAPDADAILKIPLRRNGGEDWLAWSKESSGCYTVRSAYRELILHSQQRQQVHDEISESSVVQSGDLWKKVWKLGVVQKVRVFWWRFFVESFPIMGPCHGGMSWLIALAEFAKQNQKHYGMLLLSVAMLKCFGRQLRQFSV
jgi:hypothetical protein